MKSVPPRTYSFCTFFDITYLPRGLALIESLRAQGESAQVTVLCLDPETYLTLEPMAVSLNLLLANLDDLISEYPQLVEAQKSRTTVEFYFTCSPFVIKYSQKNTPSGHLTIYLDADLYFYDSLKSVIAEIANSSIAIIEHRYPWFLKSLEKKYGKFNVGLLSFRNDPEGNNTLDWWAERCIEWCFDYPDKGKYADQGYLTDFPKQTQNLRVIKNKGLNLAPWNSGASTVRIENDRIWVDGDSLTFFHFHGLRRVGFYWISSQLVYFSPLPRNVFTKIYAPYVTHLERIELSLNLSNRRAKPTERTRPGIQGVVAKLAKYLSWTLGLALGQTLPRGEKRVRK